MLRNAKVVMIPTNKKSTYNGQLCLNGEYLFTSRESDDVGELKPQHLYVGIKESLKADDFVIIRSYVKDWRIIQVESVGDNFIKSTKGELLPIDMHHPLKIIATDNNELGIGDNVGAFYQFPQISRGFMGKYCKQFNKGDKIIDIQVFYNEGKTCTVCGAYQTKDNISCNYPTGANTSCRGKLEHRPSLNNDCISIYSLSMYPFTILEPSELVKTNYTQKEVIELCIKSYNLRTTDTTPRSTAELMEWIKSQL
jgi:hypothetical protein